MIATTQKFYESISSLVAATSSLFGQASSDVNSALAIFNAHGYGFVRVGWNLKNNNFTFFMVPAPSDIKQLVYLNPIQLLLGATALFGGSYSDVNSALAAFYSHGYKNTVWARDFQYYTFSTYELLPANLDQLNMWQWEPGADSNAGSGQAKFQYNHSNASIDLSANNGVFQPILTSFPVQHNDTLVYSEPGLDFESTSSFTLGMTDDSMNQVVHLTSNSLGSGGGYGALNSAQIQLTGAPQSVLASAETAISMSQVNWDEASFTGSDHTKLTAPATQVYMFTANVQYTPADVTGDPTKEYQFGVKINGTTYAGIPWKVQLEPPTLSVPVPEERSFRFSAHLTSGDYVQLMCLNNTSLPISISGAALTIEEL